MEAIYVLLILLHVSDIRTIATGIQCTLPILEFPNGRIDSYSNGWIRFSCNEGFVLRGSPEMRCFGGIWSSELIPKCRRPINSCEPPKPIPNGKIHGDNWKIGNTIIYVCDPGFRLLGNDKRECLSSNHWSGIEPRCQDETEPLANLANRLNNEFISKVGSYSTDSTARAIGTEIKSIGLEMLFLIDRSSSVDPVDFKRGIDFAKFLIDQFGVQNGVNNEFGTRIAIITFGDVADVIVNVDDKSIQTKQDAKNKLDSLQPGGGATAMESALSIIPGRVAPLLRQKSKRAIFLLTDGYNNVGETPPGEIAKLLRENMDFEIFTVGIGQDVNKQELIEVASSPQKNHVFLLKEYSDLKDILWLIRNKDPTAIPLEKLPNCGILPEEKNGVVEQWPWLATIYVKFPSQTPKVPKIGICSGSLICNRWVLTSASCFYGEHKGNLIAYTKNVYVSLGERNLALDEESRQNFYAVRVRLHPKFNTTTRGDNDLALIKLNEEASVTDFKTICLPEFDFVMDNRRANMAGWGNKPFKQFYENLFESSFRASRAEVNVPFATDFDCKRVKIDITDNLFCAGSISNRTCLGNLGSPLTINVKKIHYVKGVLAEREECDSRFNVFVDVEKYLEWINKVTDGCQKVES